MFNLFRRMRKWFRKQYTPAEARKLWADALRSGEFQQTEGVLCQGGKYCCLGVACEVYQRFVGDLVVKTTKAVHETSEAKKVFDDCDTVLPSKVAKWLDMTPGGTLAQPVPVKGQGWANYSLIACNDDSKMPFEDIAEIVVESNLKGFKDSDEFEFKGN